MEKTNSNLLHIEGHLQFFRIGLQNSSIERFMIFILMIIYIDIIKVDNNLQLVLKK